MTVLAPRTAPLSGWIAALFRPRAVAPPPEDDIRARRAFIDEMVSRNPHAFESDLDVQAMMGMFCERF